MKATILGTIQTDEWKATLWVGKGWVVEHPNEFQAKLLARELNAFFPANARPMSELRKMDSRDPVGWALRNAARHYGASMIRHREPDHSG